MNTATDQPPAPTKYLQRLIDQWAQCGRDNCHRKCKRCTRGHIYRKNHPGD